MLVLSRNLGEKIFIGDNICVTVVGIDRGKIRLGIEAPQEVRVDRQEIRERIASVASDVAETLMRCPDCRFPGMHCDRCNERGYVPLEMVQWIEGGKMLRARRIHHAPPQTLQEAADAMRISVDEYVRMERGCVKPTLS